MSARTPGERFFDGVNISLLVIFCLLSVYPFVYMLALSFNEGFDTMRGGVTIYPRAFTLANYAAILRDGVVPNAYKITILRTLVGTFLGVAVTAFTAYGLSERFLPGRRYIMLFLIIPMFFGGGLIPYYLVVKSYGLLDTFWVYIIPSLFSIWNCIVMKTSFMQIPESLKESMRMDGGSELSVFIHIVFPTSLPMFAAIALFVAVGHWNDWFTGAYFVTKQNLVPVQTYLQMIMNRNLMLYVDRATTLFANNRLLAYNRTTSFSLKIAAVVLGTAPILIVYPFLQKYFVKGVLIGSIKE